MMKEKYWNHVLSVRQKAPLIHNITNQVVMNNTANALLSIGASPIMAHAHEEMDAMVSLADALVINIGTLDPYRVESMLLAINRANALGKPWVLDPVGAGASPYRDEVLQKLLTLRPTVIRGNASEILALACPLPSAGKGVDSSHHPLEAFDAGRKLNEVYGAVICVSGMVDLMIDQGEWVKLSNGHPMMTRVTGLGCSATAIIGAFLAVTTDALQATAAAMALFAICGELAADAAKGPGSLQMHLLDHLYSISEAEFFNRLQCEQS